MARRLKGLSIEDLRASDTSKWSNQELREATQRMADAANKRVRRLVGDEIGRLSPTAQRALDFETREVRNLFSTKGLTTRKQLKVEFDRLRNFLNPAKKTHTIKGWKTFVMTAEKKFGIPRETFMSENFWQMYRKFADEYVPEKYSSDDLLQAITLFWTDSTNENELRKRLRDLYEQWETRQAEDWFGDASEEDWGDQW